MKPKFTLSLILFFIAVNIVITAGERNVTKIDRNIRQMDAMPVVYTVPYNTNIESVVFLQNLDPGFVTDSVTLGPEILTGITGFYDYKTNGEANIFIQVDPSNPLLLNAVDYQADSLDAVGATTRRTYYAISSDGGLTWPFSIQVPDQVRSGFPVLQLRNGSAVIANHNTNTGARLDANLYVDIAPQAGSFTEYGHPPGPAPFGIWPQIAVYNNNNVGLVSRRNVMGNGLETLYYSFWNGTNMSARSPVFFTTGIYVATVGSNMKFHIATNGQGRVTFIAAPVLQDDTLFSSRVYARTSTDNGGTWGPVEVVFRPYTENGGQDTIAGAGGSGFTYKPGTNTWFFVHPIAADGLFASGKLVMIRSDGTTSTLTTVAQVGGATTYAQNMSFVFTLDFPALGWSADGSALYCVYSVVMPDTSRGYNQRDLFFQYTLNQGTTWSNPQRLTNTPTIDETYPSVSHWNRGASGLPYEVNITYMRDPGVGPTSFGGSAPASRNNLVYRKLTGVSVIGINNNQNILKDYHLAQNYPNPFNPSTKISYSIIKSGLVTLKIYDILGREISTLVNEIQTPGQKQVEFNANNLPSGVYFYTIISGDFTDTKKMILVK